MKLINLNQSPKKFAAILLAAGSSSRMNGSIPDKILATINNKPIFAYSLQTFISSKIFSHFTIVYKDLPQKNTIQSWINLNHQNLPISYVQGGSERQFSVINALDSLHNTTDFVFIHDLARPLVTLQNLLDLSLALPQFGAAALASKPTDTILQIDTTNPNLLTPLNRNSLWAMQTPQAFDFHLIFNAYQKLKTMPLTDCSSALTILGHQVIINNNPYPNPKITKPEDLLYIKTLIDNNYVI